MYIRRKVFSLLQDETGEERYFSTKEILLENEEERLFSLVEDDEDLEQKEFARRDYEGLSKQNADILRQERSKIAESLSQSRKGIKRQIDPMIQSSESISEKTKYIRGKNNAFSGAIDDANKRASEIRSKLLKSQEIKKPSKYLATTNEVSQELSKKGFKLGKGGKIALGTAAVLGTAYGAKKLYDRKKKK